MIRAIRIFVIFACTFTFWGAWYLFPKVLESVRLSSLVAVGAMVWGADLLFIRKLGELSSLDGLTNGERSRLVVKLGNLRMRVWWTGGVGLLCTVVIWLLVTTGLAAESSFYAGALGFVFGVAASFLVLVPFWFNETQGFIDRINTDKATRESQEAEISRLAEKK